MGGHLSTAWHPCIHRLAYIEFCSGCFKVKEPTLRKGTANKRHNQRSRAGFWTGLEDPTAGAGRVTRQQGLDGVRARTLLVFCAR